MNDSEGQRILNKSPTIIGTFNSYDSEDGGSNAGRVRVSWDIRASRKSDNVESASVQDVSVISGTPDESEERSFHSTIPHNSSSISRDSSKAGNLWHYRERRQSSSTNSIDTAPGGSTPRPLTQNPLAANQQPLSPDARLKEFSRWTRVYREQTEQSLSVERRLEICLSKTQLTIQDVYD